MAKFVHLHVHSHYSLLSALPKIPDLVAAAKAQGGTALALTDRGNLYGAIEFYKECTRAGIQPIIGIDVALLGGSRLVLLAENETGYKNLLALVTESHLGEDDAGGIISRELLQRHAQGIIAVSPSLQGEIVLALRSRDGGKASKIAGEYRDMFGDKNIYLEISRHEEIDGH